MAFEIHVDKAPLRVADTGTVCIGQTRVTLQTVIAAFHRGESPEQIILNFDVLSLADVYAVITYYLNHREEVDAYIQQQEVESEQIRQEMESEYPEMFVLQRKFAKLKQQQK
ncbi:MAG: DUF433 domain-containing protein [Anaerolineae bacterium]|nr:DUF433 domain-containing protein [Anaerolineae bacterium]MDQ7034458.1 DUF433 domain-containing protein [Anaerolineae bacterium]